jgi:hypothetical protein
VDAHDLKHVQRLAEERALDAFARESDVHGTRLVTRDDAQPGRLVRPQEVAGDAQQGRSAGDRADVGSGERHPLWF